MEDRLMMAPPPPWAIICLPAHLQPKKTPLTLIWITVFQPLALMSSTLARNDAPALLTMMSTRPISFAVRSTRPLTASSWRTSTTSQKERCPSFLISSTTGSRFSFLRLQITTSAPALANSTAMERPMPTPPPVTMATFFSRENGDAAMTPPVGDEGYAGTRGLYPSPGRGALEAHGHSCAGMNEAEAGGVETEPPEGTSGPAMLAITHDGMADGRELHADLPPSPRAQRELEQARGIAVGEQAIARDGRLAVRPRGGSHAQTPILHEPAFQHARLTPDASAHQRHVDALHASGLELGLQLPLGRLGLGENEEARRLAIETVHDEGARARPLRREVIPEETVGRALPLPLGGDAQEPWGFVDHHDVRVLVDEAEAAREGDPPPRAEDDAVVRADRDATIAAHAPVELDPPRLQPLLEAPAGGLREERAQLRAEGRRVTHF